MGYPPIRSLAPRSHKHLIDDGRCFLVKVLGVVQSLHRRVGGDLFHVFGRRPQQLLQSFANSSDERELDIEQHSIALAVCHSTPGVSRQ